MNGSLIRPDSRGFSLEVFKIVSICSSGIGVGVIATAYSPFLAFVGTVIFAILAISLFVNSQRRYASTTQQNIAVAPVESPRFLFYLFYLSFFLSITIPKSGRGMGSIPITVANVCILLTLGCWLLSYIFSKAMSVHIPVWKSIVLFILCGIAAFLVGFANHNNYKYIILDFVAFVGFIPIYFLVCSVIRSSKQIQLVIWAILVSSLLICAYGIMQTRYGFEQVAVPGLTEQYGKMMYEGVGRWNVIEGGAKKVYSTFQNGNIFGNHLATFIPFIGGMLIAFPSSKKKLLFVATFILACYILVLTYSRGALFGTVSGMIALAFISKKIRLKALIVIILILGIFLVVLWQYADRPEFVRYDIRRMTSDPDSFSAGRLERAKQVIAGFTSLPFWNKLVGLGFGGILFSPEGWRFEYMDNLYLTLLFKMGIIGIFALTGMLLHLFMTLLKLRAQTSDLFLKSLINGGIAGLFGSLIHNLADTLWFFPPLAANFWFLAGITMSIGVIGSQLSPASDEHNTAHLVRR